MLLPQLCYYSHWVSAPAMLFHLPAKPFFVPAADGDGDIAPTLARGRESAAGRAPLPDQVEMVEALDLHGEPGLHGLRRGGKALVTAMSA